MPKNKQFVKTPSLLAVDESFEDQRFMKVRIDIFESGVPARGHDFRFSRKALEKAKDSLANIPVLAHVVTKKDEDGNEVLDYGAHDFHVEDDKLKDGEQKLIYDEVPVGVIPESNDLEIWDNDAGNAVLSATAYLYRDYGNYVCSILEERDGHTDVSAEVDIGEDLTYIEDDKINETDYAFLYGVTLLGEDVDPAIASAHAEMLSSNEKFLSIMQELKESLDNYTAALAAQNERKEDVQVNHFEELLTKYNLSAEDITFDHENMSDEELDKAFEELAKAKENKTEPGHEPESEPKQLAKNTIELSVTLNGKTTNLSRSLSDVICAISDLVNTTYAADGDYYGVDVFDDGSAKSKYVIMSGYYGGHNYKQAWALKDGNYILKGEREEVFSEYLTAEEREKLNTMRSNYSSLSAQVDEYKAQLAKYEAEPDKMAILQSDVYSQITETKEYTELLDNHFDITKEDLTAKLDAVLLAQAKEQGKAFLSAKKEKETSGVKMFPTGKVGETTRSRYGGAFSN